MIQEQLPIFPAEITLINNEVGFQERGGIVYYFHGHLPLFQHGKSDIESFRYITSQMHLSGVAKQSEIAAAFGVTQISIKRSVKRLREGGIKGFFSSKNKRSAHVLTPEVVTRVQKQLDQGKEVPEIARKFDLKADTIRKAIKKKTKEERRGHPRGDQHKE